MMGSATLSAPLDKAALKGPLPWQYTGRAFKMDGAIPKLYIEAGLRVITNLQTRETGRKTVLVEADFIEWLYGKKGKGGSRRIDLGKLYATGQMKRPFVTEWGLEHDEGMTLQLGPLRFNGQFLMALFMVLLMPPLFILWLMADGVGIETPQERKRRDEAFIALVKSVDAQAETDPAWLEKKTMRLALLGYAVVLGSVFLMFPLGLGLGAAALVLTGGHAAGAKLAFVIAAVPIGFAAVMAKSLLLPKFPPPGVEVAERDAPELFRFLSGMIRAVNGPRFKKVYISNEVNASVSRHTGILGFFGFGPVTLTLGLPLMQALTLTQLGGVIGHEYGHVAAKHNAKGQWIYRVRNSWLTLGDRLRFEHLWYALKLNRFYDWFIAEFSAYSFALSRRCEYEADAFAARIAGPEHAGAALCAVAVHGDAVGSLFWRDVWKQAETSKDINALAPYSRLPAFLAQARDDAEIVRRTQKEKTGYAGTHPATMDRLKALAQPFTAPRPVSRSAAADLLGPLEQQLMEAFNARWRMEAGPYWQAAHDDHQNFTKRHAELKGRALAELSREELAELVQAAHRAQDDAAVIRVSEEILRRDPASAGAQLNIAGLRLLNERDESQIPVIESCIGQKPELLPAACQYVIDHYHRRERPEAAQPWEERLGAWEYERAAADEERGLVLESDAYAPHGLPEETVAQLAAHCGRHKVLHTVYVARKQVKYMPEYPCYLVAFRRRGQMFRSDRKIQDDINAFIAQSQLPGSFLFIPADGVKGLESKLKKIPGASIYSIKKLRQAA